MTKDTHTEHYDTEQERYARILELQAQGFRQTHSFDGPEPMEYLLTEGSADARSFDGPKIYKIQWCVLRA
jgi:hypothetical protein